MISQKASDPHGNLFYYSHVGFVGVIGKVMDSAIFPEKMSSRSALLAGFIASWVKLVHFME